MTGYGLAAGTANGGKVQVEIRTVNHRHFSANLKLASPLQSLEGDLRKRVNREIHRGHVTISARWLEEPERAGTAKVNIQRAKAVLDALAELKAELDLPGEIDLAFVARQPEVLTIVAEDTLAPDEEALWGIVDEALNGVVETRAREGASLADELRSQLGGLNGLVEAVEQRAPERLVEARERLRSSVGELLDGRQVDEDRLNLEIALLADKLDVSEETVRLKTHVEACVDVLQKIGPIGRELTFLGQEMLREANTIGSKANDARVTQAVIDMKCVLEKFREQVENIE
jgi:uncharacterized protein (TIGR00255 family)